MSSQHLKPHNKMGVIERKNRTQQEVARFMLKARNVPTKFWAEVVNTTCYISNQVYLRPGTHKTSYKIWKGKKQNLKHLHEFGSPFYVLNKGEPRDKFDAKSDEVVFLGYYTKIHAYRVYNKRAKEMMESINLLVDDYLPPSVISRKEYSQ